MTTTQKSAPSRPPQTMSKGVRLAIALGAIALAVGAILLLPAILRRMNQPLDRAHMKSIASQLFDHPEIELGGRHYTVEQFGPNKLHRVKFEIGNKDYEAIEQNPEKTTEWAKLAREGHKVVQFKDVKAKRYIGVVVDGEPRDFKATDAD